INLGEFARAQRQLELATQLLAERESWEAHAQYGGAGGLWAHAWLHFARGEVEAAAAAAEESSDYPTSRELLARIALARGDRASAKRHAHGLSDLALGSLPRDALLFRATAH